MFLRNNHDINTLIRRVEREQRRAQQCLSLDILMRGDVDEVSLLFASEEDLDQFVAEASAHGFDHFNSVADTLVRQDAEEPQQFDVRFEFLKRPEDSWRIEAMAVTSDLAAAPLHSAALAEHGTPATIHASFKVKTRGEYEAVRDILAIQFGNSGGMRGEYQNTYGRFAYFGSGAVPYLKPRVNLRDA